MPRSFILVGILIVAPHVTAAVCDLSPIRFEGNQWRETIDTIIPNDDAAAASAYPVATTELLFEDPTFAEWADAEVVKVGVDVTVDASMLSFQWERTVVDRAEARGCNQRKRWAKDFERSIAGGRDFAGLFRVKYVDWSCGKWPWGTWWYNKNFEADATVRQIFMPRIKDEGRRLEIDFSGSYEDNVRPELRELVKFFANIVSITNIINKDLTKLDEDLFEQLDEYRKAIRELERFRVLQSGSAGLVPIRDRDGNPVIWLDLAFSDARFSMKGSQLLLHLKLRSAPGKELLPSQACTLRDSILEAKGQGERIGPAGRGHVVSRGENLWEIAEKYYGNGRYFHLIAGANEMRRDRALAIGENLRIEPIAKLLRNGDVAVVGLGQNLWKISGGGPEFTRVLQANRDDVANPDLIFPLQVVKKKTPQEEQAAVTPSGQ